MQGKKTGGRQLGTVNRLTRTCREAIEFASEALGGAERLAQWAAETPENEAAFWRHIYPRLLPSGVNVLALQQQREADRPRDPREVMDRLEQRVGIEGRRLFERFLREVNQLQERQANGAIERALAIAADTNAQTRGSSDDEQHAASSPSAGRS